ncbi:hypothetical protein U1Q18_005729, partial [Sarracenia purpurea var. burkii]
MLVVANSSGCIKVPQTNRHGLYKLYLWHSQIPDISMISILDIAILKYYDFLVAVRAKGDIYESNGENRPLTWAQTRNMPLTYM